MDAADINRLYGELLKGDDEHRALAPRSVSYLGAILHRAFRDAVRWNILTSNTTHGADRPSFKRPEISTWSAEQLAAFLGHLDDHRLAAAWWILATTGMRRGEVLGLRWADLNLNDSPATAVVSRTLVVADVQRTGDPGYAWSTPKTSRGWRTVALDVDTASAIRAHRRRQAAARLALGADYGDEDLVFCRRMGLRCTRRPSATTSVVR